MSMLLPAEPPGRLQSPSFWRVMALQVDREGWSWFNWGAALLDGDEARWAADEAQVKAVAEAHGFAAAALLTGEGQPIRGAWVLRPLRRKR